MDHKYIQSMLSSDDKCGICKRPALDHSNNAICECCSNMGEMNLFTIPNSSVKMLMCPNCIEKEIKGQAEIKLNAEKRINEHNLSMTARLEQVKHEILDRTDIFNAKIPSLIEIQSAIDSDDTIPSERKTFAKAEAILGLFNHLKSVIIEANKVKETATNVQRSAQSELNQLASQLRQEERDKLKLQDINYKPSPPKLASKIRAPRASKVDMVEVNKYAAELQVPPTSLLVMIKKRGCSPTEAARILKEMLS